MQDHAYETRQQYINDYAARVKLPPDEQRALWMSHLIASKHPRMDQQPKRDIGKGLSDSTSIEYMAAKLEQERKLRDAVTKLNQELADRQAWKAI